MTSFEVVWRHNQQIWYRLVEQAQRYLINVYLSAQLLSATESGNERRPGGLLSSYADLTYLTVKTDVRQRQFHTSCCIFLIASYIIISLTVFSHIFLRGVASPSPPAKNEIHLSLQNEEKLRVSRKYILCLRQRDPISLVMLVLKAIIGLLYVVLIAISLFMFLDIFSYNFPSSEASPSPYT